jgi:hypothetical protein
VTINLKSTGETTTTIDLSWDGPTGSDYRLERSLGAGAFALLSDAGTGHTYHDTGLVPHALYQYRVVYSAGGSVSTSNIVSLRTTAATGTPAAVFGTIPCLAYNDIATSTELYTVPFDTYDQHINWLNQNGYTTMNFSQYLAAIQDPTFPEKTDFPSNPILLFTDSSGAFVYDTLLPEWTFYGQTSTVALKANMLGDSWAMTNAKISGLVSNGIELASNTVTGRVLPTLSNPDIHTEIFSSKSTFASNGWNTPTLVYPEGGYSDFIETQTKAAGYVGARTTGAATITGGGFSAIDPAKAYEMGCAIPVNTTTMSDWINYVQHSAQQVEIEDAFTVVRDAGSLGPVVRAGQFNTGTYGGVYTADSGDALAFKFYVRETGLYRLDFRVKTGIRGDEAQNGSNYRYVIDGVGRAYGQSGPYVEEQQYIIWGTHTITLVLGKGMHSVTMESLQDWAMVVDSMKGTKL